MQTGLKISLPEVELVEVVWEDGGEECHRVGHNMAG